MLERLKHYLALITSGFWLLPSILTGVAIPAAYLCLWIDEGLGWKFDELGVAADADAIRDFLSLTSSSILTLAGLVFSSTLVALTLASSQYGPRLLYNFVKSRPNQIVLGLLLGNFVYSTLVLRFVAEGSVPRFSAFVSLISTLTGLGAFIYFVHHLTHSLKAESIVSSIADELKESIERHFPNHLQTDSEEREAEEERENWDELTDEKPILAEMSGYLQRIDVDTLLQRVSQFDIRARVLCRPGQLIVRDSPILAYESTSELEDEEFDKLRENFICGDRRTPEQDFEFEIRQLVEVAVRSLSPGINDPFTAINSIDVLTLSLCEIARRKLPKRVFYDEGGNSRLQMRPSSFRSILETAFIQLKQDASQRPDVAIHLLECLRKIARSCPTQKQFDEVLEIARLVSTEAKHHASLEYDRDCFESALKNIESSHEKPNS